MPLVCFCANDKCWEEGNGTAETHKNGRTLPSINTCILHLEEWASEWFGNGTRSGNAMNGQGSGYKVRKERVDQGSSVNGAIFEQRIIGFI